MKITDDAFVSLDYTLTIDGEVIDQSEGGEPLGFVFGAGQIVPGLENALKGKQTDDAITVEVPAAEGYGDVREELVQGLPRENFPDDAELEPGMVFQAATPNGPIAFKVVELKDDAIVVDLNHPLAGKDLHFAVKVIEVREATAEEKSDPADDHEHSHEDCCCGHDH